MNPRGIATIALPVDSLLPRAAGNWALSLGIMKPPKPPAPRTWSYGRAFFLTTGVAFLGLMVVVWVAQGHESKDWPAFAWVLFGAMTSAGIFSCGFAIAGSNQAVKKWLDSIGVNEGAVVIAIVAGPVYWLGQIFQKPRQKR